MDSLKLSLPLNSNSAPAAASSDLRAGSPVSDPLFEGSLALFGSLWAVTVAYVLQEKLHLRTGSWAGLFLKAAEYIAITLAAGCFGIWTTSVLRKQESAFGLAQLSRTTGAAWLFLPCLAVLYSRQSLWTFVAAALTAVIAALSLRSLFPETIESDIPPFDGEGAAIPSLYGLPPADSHPLRSVFIVLCAQAAIFCAASGDLVPALALFTLAIYLIAWRWSACDRDLVPALSSRRAAGILCLVALLCTVVALLPFAGSGTRFGRVGLAEKSASKNRLPANRASSDYDYMGVIVWPPPVKRTEILPPVPHLGSAQPGRASKPLVIPFDGPYWYFKQPHTDPGTGAHVVHKQATDVNVRSTNWLPLRMEAHQNLGLPINLACCREIDIALTNADNRPGSITLGVLLTNSEIRGIPAEDLGDQLIPSSEVDPMPPSRAPVHELLKFRIPPHGKLRQFNAITLVFQPSRSRAQLGAKVSIQSFTLIPR
jgi:hypothetical protein